MNAQSLVGILLCELCASLFTSHISCKYIHLYTLIYCGAKKAHQSSRECVCVCVAGGAHVRIRRVFYKHLRNIQQVELRNARAGGHQPEKLSQASEVQIV